MSYPSERTYRKKDKTTPANPSEWYIPLFFCIFLHCAVVHCIVQKDVDQLVPATIGLGRQAVQSRQRFLSYPDGEYPVSVISLCPLGLENQIILGHSITSEHILCLNAVMLYVKIYVIYQARI